MELTSSGWKFSIFVCLLSNMLLVEGSGNMLEGTRIPCVPGERPDLKDMHQYLEKCYSCICQNGFVDCKQEFITDGCHLLDITNSGTCSKCKGCMYKGVFHESHTEWTDPEEPCKALRCEASVVTESELQCHTPCANPNPPGPGQCCPTCSECKFNGQQAREDRDVISDDPCLKCRCTKGKMTCLKKACPVLQCSVNNQIHLQGECCPKCNGTRTRIQVPKRCYIGNAMYIEGERYDVDKCTQCDCNNETSICYRKSCPILNCISQYQIKLPGSCCKICKIPEHEQWHANSRSQCSYTGEIYQDGQTWKLNACSSCTCHKGMIHCAMTKCNDPLTCPSGTRYEHEPTECCGKCIENEGVCTVFGDPHYKTFDGKSYSFPGVGKYQLISDCHGHTFSVRVTNAFQNKNKSSAFTKRVSIKIEKMRIILGQTHRVKVDGLKIKPPYKNTKVRIEKEDDFLVLSFSLGVKILWNGKTFLEVTVPTKYKNKLCGLCGNFNGNILDEYRLRNKSLVNNIFKFGTSWCVGKDCAKKEQRIRERYCNYMKNKDKKSPCRLLQQSDVFNGCDSKLNYSYYFKACMKDMCSCPHGRCYCESLTAYAQECKRLGVNVQNWQKKSYCYGNKTYTKPTKRPPTKYDFIDLNVLLKGLPRNHTLPIN